MAPPFLFSVFPCSCFCRLLSNHPIAPTLQLPPGLSPRVPTPSVALVTHKIKPSSTDGRLKPSPKCNVVPKGFQVLLLPRTSPSLSGKLFPMLPGPFFCVSIGRFQPLPDFDAYSHTHTYHLPHLSSLLFPPVA